MAGGARAPSVCVPINREQVWDVRVWYHEEQLFCRTFVSVVLEVFVHEP